MASKPLCPSSLSLAKTLHATMASTALTTIYSKLFFRMAVRSLRTFAPSDSNSGSDIPTKNSNSDSRSKQLPHAECKENRAFNRFLKEGPANSCKVIKDEKYARMDMPGTRKQGLKLWVADNSLHAEAAEEVDDDPPSVEEYWRSYYGNIDLPYSRCKMGNSVTERKNIGFNMKTQMMMRNTCDNQRCFTSRSDATDVESSAFSTNAAGNSINGEGPGILHRMVRAIYIKEGKFPNMDNLITSSVSLIKEGKFRNINNLIQVYCRPYHRFFEEKHNKILESYGLYKKDNSDWHVVGVSKSRYISIEDFMWWYLYIPKMYKKMIYNHMFKQQIYVLESCPVTSLTYVVVCFWEAPRDGWYKLNVSVFFKENVAGTKEAFCGGVFRDFKGRILEIFHKPLPDATSRDEVFLLGVHHGIDEILRRRPEEKKIILEIEHKKIVKVLSRGRYTPIECELYQKIFGLLFEFDEYEILFQYSQGNAIANRVAYIASHLTVGQSFPKGNRGFETEVKLDRLNIPRLEIVLKERIGDEESSDEESSDEELSDEELSGFRGSMEFAAS